MHGGGLVEDRDRGLSCCDSVTFHRVTGRDKTGYHDNLRCLVVSSHGGCTDGGCTVKQVGPIRMSGQHPTCFDCLCELKALIMWDHGDNYGCSSIMDTC